MPTTQYKGWSVPTTGTFENTWGTEINDNTFAIGDRNLGGIVPKTLAASNVTLTAEESENLIVRLTGTLTADVDVETVCQGVTIVENLTTGSFAVNFGNSVSKVKIPQNSRAVVITDTTNGARAAANNLTEFSSGTKMMFFQSTAPTGWTKQTVTDNAAIRLTTGSTGGNTIAGTNFTSVFASRALSGTVGNTTLTVAQLPAHGHPFRLGPINQDNSGAAGGFLYDTQGSQTNYDAFSGTPTGTNGQQIGGTGEGQAHNHSVTINSLNMAVAYVDGIICTKD